GRRPCPRQGLCTPRLYTSLPLRTSASNAPFRFPVAGDGCAARPCSSIPRVPRREYVLGSPHIVWQELSRFRAGLETCTHRQRCECRHFLRQWQRPNVNHSRVGLSLKVDVEIDPQDEPRSNATRSEVMSTREGVYEPVWAEASIVNDPGVAVQRALVAAGPGNTLEASLPILEQGGSRDRSAY